MSMVHLSTEDSKGLSKITKIKNLKELFTTIFKLLKMPPKAEHKIIDGIKYKLCNGKLCNGIWKPLNEFGIDNKSWDKLNYSCKNCKNLNSRNNYNNPKPKIEKQEEEIERTCNYCNKTFALEQFTAYVGEKGNWMRIYKCKNCVNLRRKNRRETDPNYKIRENLRHRIYLALRGGSKTAKTKDLLDCTIDELWNHLESKFEEGMTRENHGSIWHIDHIIPCNAFDLTKEQEQRRCFNYRNLQPMFASANISKGDSPKFEVIKNYNRILCQFNNRKHKFDPSAYEAWCFRCGIIQEFAPKECANDIPNLNGGYTCDVCKTKEGKVDPDEYQKTCPGCEVMTYKAGGCNHMTCTMCDVHWCWVCRWKHVPGGLGIYDHLHKEHGGTFDFERREDEDDFFEHAGDY